MKCKICGAESGKYPLCKACNLKKEKGEIIKCEKCGNWHYTNIECPIPKAIKADENYLYDVKDTLISKSEQSFYNTIIFSLPEGYSAFPQINLATFINRTDNSRFHNELFRNVDFLITDAEYKPKFIIEINDQTHLNNERKERDEKVRKICEEAGIPILKLWTSYGVNPKYIKERIEETLNKIPISRIHHFNEANNSQKQTENNEVYISTNIDTDITYIPRKSKKIALILCLLGFLGLNGLHRFYVEKTVSGIAYFFTFGIYFIGTIVDLISILSGNFKDCHGQPLE